MNGEVCASEYMGNEVCKLFALTGGTVTFLQENKITSHSYNNSRNYQTHVVLLILPPKLILQ